jgi:phosphoribosyl 1,2-cyclic phosphodiesterase
LWVISDSGLVWSMNCDSCEEPKNSRTAAAAGFALIRSCGMTVSISTDAHALLDRALHAQQTDAVLVLHQLADSAHATVAEVVDVVDLALGSRSSPAS